MQIKNTVNRYGIITILSHWLMAVLIMAILALGLYMTSLTADNPQKFQLYDLHKGIGVLILMLVIIRIIWRLTNMVPTLPITTPKWEKFATRAAHWAFYGFMFALPISGWFMSSAGGYPVSFFGLFTLPNLIPVNKNLHHFLEESHEWLAYVLIAIICIHIAAALKHYFIDKDDILQRIFSSRSK